jgi:hypothetical protein
VRLHQGWREVQVPNAPVTYVRSGPSSQGALQFSLAQFKAGPLPDSSEQTLLAMCEKLANNVRGLREKSSRSGPCDLGTLGTVVVRREAPVYFQVWVLSNGREFILVTHTCDREPTPDEIAEANEIALMTGYI